MKQNQMPAVATTVAPTTPHKIPAAEVTAATETHSLVVAIIVAVAAWQTVARSTLAAAVKQKAAVD